MTALLRLENSKTLAELGVKSISLHTQREQETDAYGNTTTLRSNINMNFGEKRIISDVWFKSAQ